VSPLPSIRALAAIAASAFLLSAAGAAAPDAPPDLAEVAAAARQLSARLPMRADDITTAVAIRADGAEFVYEMAVSQALPADRIEQIRRSIQDLNQSRMCENAEVAPFIRRGGSMRHIYVDQAGHRFETRVSRCP